MKHQTLWHVSSVAKHQMFRNNVGTGPVSLLQSANVGGCMQKLESQPRTSGIQLSLVMVVIVVFMFEMLSNVCQLFSWQCGC